MANKILTAKDQLIKWRARPIEKFSKGIGSLARILTMHRIRHEGSGQTLFVVYDPLHADHPTNKDLFVYPTQKVAHEHIKKMV